jgi:hypothetical protein
MSVFHLYFDADEAGESIAYYANREDAQADKAFLEDLTRNRDPWLTFAIAEEVVLHTTQDGTSLRLKAREIEESWAEPGDWIASDRPPAAPEPVELAPGQEPLGL